MLAGIIKRMDVPTDESIVGTKDSGSILNESIRAIPSIRIVENVNECFIDQNDTNLYHRII